MNRRQFLQQCAFTGFATAARPNEIAQNTRIGISTWSFHNLFTPTRDKESAPISGKPLDARDFPDMIADRYHVHEMEIVAPHIATEPSYIRELKARLDGLVDRGRTLT